MEVIKTYTQLIWNTKSHVFSRSELLSRIPHCPVSVEGFFDSLSIDNHFEILSNQIKVAEKIYRANQLISSINFSNKFIAYEHFDRLFEALSNRTCPLILECTETYPMVDNGLCNELFSRLKEMDIQISLDGFGTGFNGMSILADYDFDIIKIDRTLISQLRQRPGKIEPLKVIVDRIRRLGKISIIEGVEEKKQQQLVEAIKPDYIQGFYHHEPEPYRNIVNSQLVQAC